MYTSDEKRFEGAVNKFYESTVILSDEPKKRPLVLDRVE